jgi:hypothetical protein
MNEKEFVKKWVEKIKEVLPVFPDDFINGVETQIFNMPGKPITLGSELFGQFEIVDTDGNSILQTDDYSFIKYVLYSNRIKPSEIIVPKEKSDISKVVKTYEAKLDMFIKEIKSELNKVLPTSDFMKISKQIFNSLNLLRY